MESGQKEMNEKLEKGGKEIDQKLEKVETAVFPTAPATGGPKVLSVFLYQLC